MEIILPYHTLSKNEFCAQAMEVGFEEFVARKFSFCFGQSDLDVYELMVEDRVRLLLYGFELVNKYVVKAGLNANSKMSLPPCIKAVMKYLIRYTLDVWFSREWDTCHMKMRLTLIYCLYRAQPIYERMTEMRSINWNYLLAQGPSPWRNPYIADFFKETARDQCDQSVEHAEESVRSEDIEYLRQEDLVTIALRLIKMFDALSIVAVKNMSIRVVATWNYMYEHHHIMPTMTREYKRCLLLACHIYMMAIYEQDDKRGFVIDNMVNNVRFYCQNLADDTTVLNYSTLKEVKCTASRYIAMTCVRLGLSCNEFFESFVLNSFDEYFTTLFGVVSQAYRSYLLGNCLMAINNMNAEDFSANVENYKRLMNLYIIEREQSEAFIEHTLGNLEKQNMSHVPPRVVKNMTDLSSKICKGNRLSNIEDCEQTQEDLKEKEEEHKLTDPVFQNIPNDEDILNYVYNLLEESDHRGFHFAKLVILIKIIGRELNVIETWRYHPGLTTDFMLNLEIRLAYHYEGLARIFAEYPFMEQEFWLTAFYLNPSSRLYELVVRCGPRHHRRRMTQGAGNDENQLPEESESKGKLNLNEPKFGLLSSTIDVYEIVNMTNHETPSTDYMPLCKALRSMKLPEQVIKDLLTVTFLPRNKSFSWAVNWQELRARCKFLLKNPMQKRRFVELNMAEANDRLKFLKVDYEKYKNRPQIDYGSIEMGYEHVIANMPSSDSDDDDDVDFSGDESGDYIANKNDRKRRMKVADNEEDDDDLEDFLTGIGTRRTRARAAAMLASAKAKKRKQDEEEQQLLEKEQEQIEQIKIKKEPSPPLHVPEVLQQPESIKRDLQELLQARPAYSNATSGFKAFPDIWDFDAKDLHVNETTPMFSETNSLIQRFQTVAVYDNENQQRLRSGKGRKSTTLNRSRDEEDSFSEGRRYTDSSDVTTESASETETYLSNMDSLNQSKLQDDSSLMNSTDDFDSDVSTVAVKDCKVLLDYTRSQEIGLLSEMDFEDEIEERSSQLEDEEDECAMDEICSKKLRVEDVKATKLMPDDQCGKEDSNKSPKNTSGAKNLAVGTKSRRSSSKSPPMTDTKIDSKDAGDTVGSKSPTTSKCATKADKEIEIKHATRSTTKLNSPTKVDEESNSKNDVVGTRSPKNCRSPTASKVDEESHSKNDVEGTRSPKNSRSSPENKSLLHHNEESDLKGPATAGTTSPKKSLTAGKEIDLKDIAQGSKNSKPTTRSSTKVNSPLKFDEEIDSKDGGEIPKSPRAKSKSPPMADIKIDSKDAGGAGSPKSPTTSKVPKKTDKEIDSKHATRSSTKANSPSKLDEEIDLKYVTRSSKKPSSPSKVDEENDSKNSADGTKSPKNYKSPTNPKSPLNAAEESDGTKGETTSKMAADEEIDFKHATRSSTKAKSTSKIGEEIDTKHAAKSTTKFKCALNLDEESSLKNASESIKSPIMSKSPLKIDEESVAKNADEGTKSLIKPNTPEKSKSPTHSKSCSKIDEESDLKDATEFKKTHSSSVAGVESSSNDTGDAIKRPIQSKSSSKVDEESGSQDSARPFKSVKECQSKDVAESSKSPKKCSSPSKIDEIGETRTRTKSKSPTNSKSPKKLDAESDSREQSNDANTKVEDKTVESIKDSAVPSDSSRIERKSGNEDIIERKSNQPKKEEDASSIKKDDISNKEKQETSKTTANAETAKKLGSDDNVILDTAEKIGTLSQTEDKGTSGAFLKDAEDKSSHATITSEAVSKPSSPSNVGDNKSENPENSKENDEESAMRRAVLEECQRRTVQVILKRLSAEDIAAGNLRQPKVSMKRFDIASYMQTQMTSRLRISKVYSDSDENSKISSGSVVSSQSSSTSSSQRTKSLKRNKSATTRRCNSRVPEKRRSISPKYDSSDDELGFVDDEKDLEYKPSRSAPNKAIRGGGARSRSLAVTPRSASGLKFRISKVKKETEKPVAIIEIDDDEDDSSHDSNNYASTSNPVLDIMGGTSTVDPLYEEEIMPFMQL